MKRFSELLLIPRNHLKFKFIKNIKKYEINPKYQIIDFYWKKDQKIFKKYNSITFNKITFQFEFKNKLDKSKKIIIDGKWMELKYYYHFLKFHGFKVFLLK
ncbi:hypothetical protein [Mycoplasmoides alvi]|uniref:hypothetical protein n=1 Tax=Mycoplasmoides alvi TaxID=78580 RepID=UPI00051AE7E1|nr:hypothetical protein [Mycoplasmoides alvi]